MKPKLLLPPAVALVVTGIWLCSQHRSISALEKETVLLREHLAAARASDPAEDDRSLTEARARGKKTPDPDVIDWKELADTMGKMQSGGIPDMRSMMKLQTKLMNMSSAELIAALDEIAILELSEGGRSQLEEVLIGALAEKEPQLVLDRFLHKLGDQRSGASWQLTNAFRQWAAKDGKAAETWFDEQIAAGKFDSKSLDGKNQARLQFEATIVMKLIESDPEAAGKRIAAFPEDQRRELFQLGISNSLKPGSEKAFAALIRENVPQAEQGAAFSGTTSMMIYQGGYEKVGSFLDDIEATPAERTAIASQAANTKLQQLSRSGTIDRAVIDEMRTWVGQQSPDSVDTVTGKALGNMWNDRVKWEDNAKLIEELHGEGGSDDLLISFLAGNQASQHRDESLALAGKIGDETKRAEVIAKLDGKPARTQNVPE